MILPFSFFTNVDNSLSANANIFFLIFLAMCQNFNYSFFANDASVVKFKDNIPFMLRGDQEFKVRLNGLKAYSQKYYEDESTKFNDNKELWYNKSKIEPDDIGVNKSSGSHAITHIFFVKLDTLVEGCVINHYNCKSEVDKWFKPKMQLFQNVNGTIRGSDLIPYGNDGKILDIVIPSLDANNDRWVNMLKYGIIDPAKVTKNALLNAASISATIITTEVGIVISNEGSAISFLEML